MTESKLNLPFLFVRKRGYPFALDKVLAGEQFDIHQSGRTMAYGPTTWSD